MDQLSNTRFSSTPLARDVNAGSQRGPGRVTPTWAILAVLLLAGACGGSEADELGVGAECTLDDDCDWDDDFERVCLTQFAGGYCGLTDCASDLDCPEDAACIAHTDGSDYCFRTCIDKIDCNTNRSVENESNCSSNVTFVDGAQGRKACVPPSSGT